MDNSLQYNSPPTPPHGFRSRPRPLLQSSSPLNPNHADGIDTKPASAQSITTFNLRRMSNSSFPYSYSRRGSVPGTPIQRCSPRSPLSYISPSLSGVSTASSLSADGWPLTPQSPLSRLPIPSSPLNDHSLPTSKPKSPLSPPVASSHPSSRLSVSIDLASSDHRPAYIKRRHDLDDLPPSPPIVNPGYLLEHHIKPYTPADHSIASPFLNLDTSPNHSHDPERHSPLTKRTAIARRPSALAHELGNLDIVHDDAISKPSSTYL